MAGVDDRMPLLSGGGNTGYKAAGGGSYKPMLSAPAFTVTATTPSDADAAVSEAAAGDSQHGEDGEEHRTTVQQTFIHLLKGYIGPGMLSLPWAVSQLGIPVGCVAIFIMAFWSSYNCWTVVRLKRFIEHQRNSRKDADADDDKAVSETGSSITANTNVTYPDVGEWAYGKTFQSWVSGCICTQQLAICTVFISFIGENVLAVLEELPDLDLGIWESHIGVMTMAVALVLPLSFIPSIKGLSPVMAAGTILLLVCLALLGQVAGQLWSVRPTEPATFNPPMAPLALCAILYSFEGICLILPIESAMQDGKHFKPIFVLSMGIVALILAFFSSICVSAFGNVTNGSVTAFLVQKYQDNDTVRLFLLLANLAVSLSVLFTYPLQLFPAVELLGPSWAKFWGTYQTAPMADDEEEEKDLTGFDIMPPLPEHDTVVMHEWEDALDEHRDEHRYDDKDDEAEADAREKKSGTAAPTLNEIPKRDDETDQISLRSFMSSALNFPNQMMPKMILPGDSPYLRATLVFFTFAVAVIVPNVQALISLAGALAGSSSALLIPPVMEMAYIKHLEQGSLVPLPLQPPGTPGGRLVPAAVANVSLPFFTKWWKTKVKCYLLLFLGAIFLLIGTYASLADISAIYMHKE